MMARQPVAETIDRRLRSLGLAGIGAVFLEALAPLAPVGAQLAYILQPMFEAQPGGLWTELAQLLEEPSEVEALSRRLREGSR